MNETQFAQLLEKLDWIGFKLEEIEQRQREITDYPRQVEVVEKRR